MWSECSGTFWKVVWCSSTSFLPSQAAANPKADRSEGIHARRRAYSSWMTRCASPAELTAWGLKGGAIQADHRNGRPDAGSPAGREARPQGTWGTSTQRVREKPGPGQGPSHLGLLTGKVASGRGLPLVQHGCSREQGLQHPRPQWTPPSREGHWPVPRSAASAEVRVSVCPSVPGCRQVLTRR